MGIPISARMLMHFAPFLSLSGADDVIPASLTTRQAGLGAGSETSPWVWQHAWKSDMPAFFTNNAGDGSDPMYNALDYLDDSVHPWVYGAPVDPGQYQDEYIGSAIGIY